MERMQVALVTGSSTGIGFETSLALSRNGIHTFATMRDSHKSDAIKKIAREESLPLEVLEMDVDNEDSVTKAVLWILDEKKRIDILVNNAGYGLFGALEDISIAEIRKQFETNYFGAVRAIKEVLPSMRKQRSGIIMNITSIAGVVGIPGESIYSSSKFALEGLSESISYELKPYGIKVVLIEPGVINSNFVPNIRYPNNAEKKSNQKTLREENGANSRGSDLNHVIEKISTSLYYSNTIDAFMSHYYVAMKNAPPPTLVAAVIIEAIKSAMMSSQYLFRYTVGEDSKSLADAKKNMTDFQLHDYISKRMLA
jgi:NAD(P)-dependent dehydrogenase (short-subunit alcohol dehydrogenase family)